MVYPVSDGLPILDPEVSGKPPQAANHIAFLFDGKAGETGDAVRSISMCTVSTGHPYVHASASGVMYGARVKPFSIVMFPNLLIESTLISKTCFTTPGAARFLARCCRPKTITRRYQERSGFGAPN